MRESRVPVWGTEVLVLEEGEPGGPAAIFLHGFGSGARAWLPVLPAMAASGLRCLAVDLPGFGETRPPSPPFDLPRPGRPLAEFMGALLTALGIPRAHLVGWSLGGALALHAAAHLPARVDRMVLAAPAGLGTAVAFGLRLLGLPWVGRRLASAPLPELPPGEGPVRLPEYLARQPVPRDFVDYHLEITRRPHHRETVLRAARMANIFFLGQKRLMPRVPLERIAAPTLILWGREDGVLPPSQGIRAARRKPRAELQLYDDCGHCLPVEYPERFVRAASSFLLAPDPDTAGAPVRA